jgi:translation initiation factor IF-3
MINQFVVKKYVDVRLIGPDGEQIGILRSRDAWRQAQEQNLDLVLVSESATPPVCKIADYGKLKYEERKHKKAQKKRVQEVKGLKISPRIAAHDLEVNTRKAREFLEEGDKVRVVCQFRAREITHPELGRRNLECMAEALKDISTVELAPKLYGKQMIMVLTPGKRA